MNVFLQYVVPVLSVPFLMLFKYGKPRGYLKDFFAWHTKPRIYCGLEPDSGMKFDYFKKRRNSMPRLSNNMRHRLHQPAFSELLPVRDILNDIIIRTTGAFVAGYELSGINSYYHNDEGRNRTKLALEALVRSLPERSMRMQVRFEIAEGVGRPAGGYQQQLRNQNPTLLALDRLRLEGWRKKEQDGYYLRPLLHAYFHWNPTIHHELAGASFGKISKRLSLDSFSLSATKCIQRTRREHEDLLSEFTSILSGVEQTLTATGMAVRRLNDGEIFLEMKRALNPLLRDPYSAPPSGVLARTSQYARSRSSTPTLSTRKRHISESAASLLLHHPEGPARRYFPRHSARTRGARLPLTVNTEVMIPDQAAMIKHYKGRLQEDAGRADGTCTAAFRINVDAQVAQRPVDGDTARN